MASTQNRFSVLKQAHEAITRTSKPKKHYLALKMSINILSLHFLELKCCNYTIHSIYTVSQKKPDLYYVLR